MKYFIGNIPYAWTTKELLEFTGATEGEIAMNGDRSKGHGWVLATSPEHAIEIINKHNTPIGHIKLRVQQWNKEREHAIKQG